MIYNIFPSILFLFLSIQSNKIAFTNPISPKVKQTSISLNSDEGSSDAEKRYDELKSSDCALPSLEGFTLALEGFAILKDKGLIQKNILTLVDFSMSSNTKRLWVIDLDTNTILYNSLVAHGKNTGEEYANSFSNLKNSFKSSLGFYSTGETYKGKHGISLKLDGLEKGINDKARERGVVIHAANYVSETFIKNNKRLGRSEGCPALPVELSKDIINTIKNKSCLFIYHPSENIETITNSIS